MYSFSISSKKNQPVVSSKAFENEERGGSSSDDEKDYVKSIDNKTGIKGSKSKPKKEELVIPLIAKNNWTPQGSASELERQAVREILEYSSSSKKEQSVGFTEVPILLRNRVPEGFENDDNLNVSLRPEQPTLDDYERIPIEQFGLAMLRGMGWKKGEGIGLTNKRVVEAIEPRLRPKGLGLGAERPQTIQDVKPTSSNKAENENLTLKKGACVRINRGINKGKYGKVEAFDEDNNRVIVQMSIGGKMLGISTFGITLVPESEFSKKSKVLNSDLYDEYKQKHVEADEQRQKLKVHETLGKKSSEDEKKDIQTKSSTGTGGRVVFRASKKDWVVPNLRVRFIDQKFREGKYYKQKFLVIDVMEKDHFVLKSDTGEVIDKVRTSQLETVIPKISSGLVYILTGKHKGKVGKLIEKDNRDEVGVIQIPDEGVVELHFDDICEFVGDIEDYL